MKFDYSNAAPIQISDAISNMTRCRLTRARHHLRYYVFGAVLAFLLTMRLLSQSINTGRGSIWHPFQDKSPRELAANRTLGFEKLLVLAPRASWRTRGLKAAADLTGIEFSIPTQPQNPESFVRAFEGIAPEGGTKKPAHGSATAWMAHLDLLKHFISSGFSSALIVEDDVDWDIDLLNQMQLISDNVRNFTNTPATDPTPYGSGWDILWLGHCGSIIYPAGMKRLTYRDPTRCRTELYSGWSKRFLREMVPEQHRLVQESATTVCTFAYGVTHQSAQSVLTLLGRAGDEAYDVALSNHCHTGQLKCVVINPQVMNHYEPARELGYISPVNVADGRGTSVDEIAFEQTKGTTGNIVNSSRCKALFDDACMRPPSEI